MTLFAFPMANGGPSTMVQFSCLCCCYCFAELIYNNKLCAPSSTAQKPANPSKHPFPRGLLRVGVGFRVVFCPENGDSRRRVQDNSQAIKAFE